MFSYNSYVACKLFHIKKSLLKCLNSYSIIDPFHILLYKMFASRHDCCLINFSNKIFFFDKLFGEIILFILFKHEKKKRSRDFFIQLDKKD